MFVSFLCMLAVLQPLYAASIQEVSLPQISYDNLIAHDHDSVQNMIKAFQNLGALQIVNIPNFAKARESALTPLANCFDAKEAIASIAMPDGSKRVSAAAASFNGKAGEMNHECGESAKDLRNIVDATTTQMFAAMDSMIPTGSKAIMQPNYKTFSDLMSHGDHLEHLHAYYATNDISADSKTMNMHTDTGLLIAMTTGLIQGQDLTSASGLYLQLPTGEEVKVKVADDSLIILMGEGANRWFSPVYGSSFRAAPHSMLADLQGKGSRSWYGKMFLPPENALIQTQGVNYGRYRYLEADASLKSFVVPATLTQDLLPSACSHTSSKSVLASNTLCVRSDNSTGVMCWMQCMSVVNITCGLEAVCMVPSTGAVVAGSAMCHDPVTKKACVLSCGAPTAAPSFPPTYYPSSRPTSVPTLAPTWGTNYPSDKTYVLASLSVGPTTNKELSTEAKDALLKTVVSFTNSSLENTIFIEISTSKTSTPSPDRKLSTSYYQHTVVTQSTLYLSDFTGFADTNELYEHYSDNLKANLESGDFSSTFMSYAQSAGATDSFVYNDCVSGSVTRTVDATEPVDTDDDLISNTAIILLAVLIPIFTGILLIFVYLYFAYIQPYYAKAPVDEEIKKDIPAKDIPENGTAVEIVGLEKNI